MSEPQDCTTTSVSNSRSSSPDVLVDRKETSNSTSSQSPFYAAARKQLKHVRPLTPPPEGRDPAPVENAEFQRVAMEREARRLSKTDERLEEQKIREKLRSMPAWKKELEEKKKIKGPMLAKPPSPSSSPLLTISSASSVSSMTSSKDTSSSSTSSHHHRSRRNQSPSNESPFTRQVVNRPVSPTVPRRRATSSPTSTKPSSPTAYSRRTPSPQGDGYSALSSEDARKKVEKVQRARLYLLQQNGPNSFTIGGDAPDNKFKVIIGPQKCSCGKGHHCIHLLFVMLRVFQVKDSDPLLWSRELKNFEVEALFQQYHARRKSLLKKLSRSSSFKSAKSKSGSKENVQSETPPSTPEPNSEQSSTKDLEEEVCPICLLEMIEGESLVVCQDGCHNKLHHHCVAIWAEECKRMNEQLICPLCRASWNLVGQFSDNESQVDAPTVPPNTRASSPVPSEVVLPQAEPIPVEHMKKAQPWIEVFGNELISCLFSRNWVTRETGLHRLSRDVVGALLPGVGEGRATANVTVARQVTSNSVLENGCQILAMMCGDPVYKVYIAALRALRSMLAYVPCRDEQQTQRLQSYLKPVMEAILFKCADGNRRTSQLSISTLVELCRGQNGELAIGREIVNPGTDGIGGVKFVMTTIVTSSTNSNPSSNWQWLLGRLYVIDKLLDQFPQEFALGPCRDNDTIDSAYASRQNYENQDFLLSVLKFALPAVTNSHASVAKYGKRIFVNISRMVVHASEIFLQVSGMLEDLPPTPGKRMKRRLLGINEEYQIQREQALRIYHDEDFTEPLTPYATPTDTPSHGSPNPSPQSTAELDCLVSVARRTLQKRELYDTHIDGVSEGILTPPLTPKEKKPANHQSGAKSDCEASTSQSEAEAELDGARPTRPKSFNFSESSGKKSTGGKKGKGKKSSKSRVLEKDPSQERASDTTEDLSDLSVFSPVSPSEMPVSFKSEVASQSPKHQPKYQEDVSQLHCCQELVEAEEAEAFAIAMESSVTQMALPMVPGLSSEEEDEFTVHVQPEGGDESDKGSVYMEGEHWIKGPLIGSGAFSTCYQARDVKSGTIMAVKQVSFCRNSKSDQEKVVSAILEEIAMLARMDHPHVSRLIGATQQGAHFNLFVEWMPGGSVASLLERYGAFQEVVIVRYMRQILHGIAYLHENQVIHRDLKGANLLIDSTGHHLRIADFGAAARMAAKTTMTGEFQGQLLGTIAFMAPEVLRGETYGRSCDIWSIGCCLVEMSSSKPPWEAGELSNHLALIFKIASAKGPPKIPDYLSPALRDLGIRCLEHQPEHRPPAKELLKHAVFTRY
ncbi:mitogen-activated protein kinase kinase kinase 1-like [Ptychodera flava]|uniref:mitogen-activated protein kinase kinase kinase 1-like n=1 Tax=Ptychodera flava TaxID=63121 RepID=UPI00396A3391